MCYEGLSKGSWTKKKDIVKYILQIREFYGSSNNMCITIEHEVFNVLEERSSSNTLTKSATNMKILVAPSYHE